MSDPIQQFSAGSQTVGPFFRIGLEWLIDSAPAVSGKNAIRIQGRVLDRDGAPVPDAMLEFWCPAVSSPAGSSESGFPAGFRRAATDAEGNYSVTMHRPLAVAMDDGRSQAPHLLVLVFCRGLLRHLLTRVYLCGQPENTADPVLQAVPPARQNTLLAQPCGDGAETYRWNVILQGPGETVFFAW